MNELSRHQAAQRAFLTCLERQREALAVALRMDNLMIDGQASVRTLVRLARTRTDREPALEAFESSVRGCLVAYVNATPKGSRHLLHPDAQFLLEHFNRFTEVPITASPVKRVVSWARRKLGGVVKEPGDVN